MLKHDWLAVALLVVVAALEDGVPGTTQAAWQLAAVELQSIMQLVTAELCARRPDLSPPAANALGAQTAIAIAANADANAKPCTTTSSMLVGASIAQSPTARNAPAGACSLCGRRGGR